MPTYQYQCEACNHAFEIQQSIIDSKLHKCPHCGKSKLNRLIGTGAGGLIFKGSGFYETDYRKSVPKGSCPAKDSKGNCACEAAKKTS